MPPDCGWSVVVVACAVLVLPPAVVVVDSVPSRLLPDPLRLPLKLVLGSALGLLVATLVLFAKGDFTRRQPDVATGNGEANGQLEPSYRDRVVTGGN